MKRVHRQRLIGFQNIILLCIYVRLKKHCHIIIILSHLRLWDKIIKYINIDTTRFYGWLYSDKRILAYIYDIFWKLYWNILTAGPSNLWIYYFIIVYRRIVYTTTADMDLYYYMDKYIHINYVGLLLVTITFTVTVMR